MSSVTNTPANPITPEEIVRQLRALREQIPDFVLLPRAESQPLVRAATIDIEFVHASINAIAASPALENALGRDAATLRGETELNARWSQVVDELEAFRLGVTGAITVHRHRVGATALRAYQVSRHLARYKEHATLLPHIEAMRRASKFPKRRAAQSKPPADDSQVEPLALKKAQ